ncbi:putative defense protein 1 [Penaeus vannamei]|uniref:putative defense protein 1 n=1 Tax=Penaeus vannamei TaxID=6689 RepID=UPI000F677259|nr:putative defense protein 1 [Penaeus vannamei]
MRLVLVGALVASLGLVAHGWPSGAPENACSSMVPQHVPNPTADQNVDYSLSSSQNGDGTYTVTIKAQNNEMFKGFMVRGFVDGKPNGSFLNAPTGLTCDNIPNTAATHQDNVLKNQVQLIWQGDANPVFRATIVKNRNSFFMI